jgi:4-amino-4-deoxy-L-arabinose transferase-like glycosyltransferase
MSNRTFAWEDSKRKTYYQQSLIERLWIIGLFIAGILLYGINLSGTAVADLGNEGINAQIAREIYQASANSLTWLYPTLNGEPYIHHPPLLYGLIAIAYQFFGISTISLRLPVALLGAISVPFIYLIGREIFKIRLPALFSAFIYLSLLPVVRYSRLALSEAAILSFFILMIWCTLRSRRDLRFALGIGISLGLICLTKGLTGLLFIVVPIVFLIFDTPRLLKSFYLWTGILLGIAPVGFWYVMQWLKYKQLFINAILQQFTWQNFFTVHGHYNYFLTFYLLELGLPWLLFLPEALKIAKKNQAFNWAKLILVWFNVGAIIILLMPNKHIGFWLPIYPPLALAVGAYLAQMWIFPERNIYLKRWPIGLTAIALINAAGIFLAIKNTNNVYLHLVLIAVLITLLTTAILMQKEDIQFIPILFWGTYVSVFLLMLSPYWVWETHQSYQVDDVGLMVQKNTPKSAKIYTYFDYKRPALNFYSQRQITPINQPETLKSYWQKEPESYFLLDEKSIDKLKLTEVKQLAKIEPDNPDNSNNSTWKLIKREK